MKKRNGFTFAELIVIVAIIGILVSMAVPSIEPALRYTEKNKVNVVHKILINAVDSWVKANYDAAQRPDNINSKNSQGRAVYEYISSQEVYQGANLIKGTDRVTFGPKEAEKVFVKFEKGVITTEFVNDPAQPSTYKKIFGMYELDGEEIKDYNSLLNLNYIVGPVQGSGVKEYAEIKK